MHRDNVSHTFHCALWQNVMRCVRCPPHQHLNPEPSAQGLCFMSLCCSAWDTSDGTSTPTLLLGLGQIVVGNAVVIMGLISMNWSLLQCQNHLSVLFHSPAEAHTCTPRIRSTIWYSRRYCMTVRWKREIITYFFSALLALYWPFNSHLEDQGVVWSMFTLSTYPLYCIYRQVCILIYINLNYLVYTEMFTRFLLFHHLQQHKHWLPWKQSCLQSLLHDWVIKAMLYKRL